MNQRIAGSPTDAEAVQAANSDLLDFYFGFQPRSGRDVGRREYDGVLAELASPGVEAMADLRRRLAAYVTVPDPGLRADVRTSLAWLDRETFRIEALGHRHRDPVECLGEADVWGYIQQPYGTVEEKIAAIDRHLSGVPDFLERAAPLVDASLPAGERMHALDLSRALAADLRDIQGMLDTEHPGVSVERLVGPAQEAASACERFAAIVEKSAPVAAVFGPELLQEWIRLSELVDVDLPVLIEEAQAEVDGIVGRLDALAARAGVERRRDLHDQMEHPDACWDPARYMPDLIERLRQFWRDRGVVSVETVSPLLCRSRPRMFAAAEFGVAGPFPDDAHPHRLYLPRWTDLDGAKASRRKNFALPVLEMLAVHETHAGHYSHTEAAFRSTHGVRSSLRLWAGFVEGWAHYTEELAIEQGLADGRPLVHAAQQLAALEAATRLLVFLSVHSGRWTFGAAVEQAARVCEWPAPQAIREVLSATSDWRTSLYTFGKLRIREWRRSAVTGSGAAELRAFHDGILAAGFPPLGVVWQYYLETRQPATGDTVARTTAAAV